MLIRGNGNNYIKIIMIGGVVMLTLVLALQIGEFIPLNIQYRKAIKDFLLKKERENFEIVDYQPPYTNRGGATLLYVKYKHSDGEQL